MRKNLPCGLSELDTEAAKPELSYRRGACPVTTLSLFILWFFDIEVKMDMPTRVFLFLHMRRFGIR